MSNDSKLSAKMKLIAKLCADDRLSHADLRNAVTMLATFHNNKNGKCYPSHPQIGEAATTSESAAIRTTAKLKALGYCSFDENKGGRNKRNEYDFSEALKVVANGPLIDEKPGQGDTLSESETLSTERRNPVNVTAKPCQGDTRIKPTNKPIDKPRGEATPATRKRVAASQKGNGKHGNVGASMREKQPMEREISPWAQTVLAKTLRGKIAKAAREKAFPIAKPPRHVATEAERIAYEHIARGEKPPPTVLEAGRLVNVSSFPNATAKKPWTRPTISEESEAEIRANA